MTAETVRPGETENMLELAVVAARRGTCPRLQVGAVIAREGRVLVTGRNGSAPGEEHCGDHADGERCTRALHAERNAVAFAARFGVALNGATVYVTHAPCFDCAGVLLSAGIERVIFGWRYRSEAGVARLAAGGVKVEGAW